jgi:hypothetical protein
VAICKENVYIRDSLFSLVVILSALNALYQHDYPMMNAAASSPTMSCYGSISTRSSNRLIQSMSCVPLYCIIHFSAYSHTNNSHTTRRVLERTIVLSLDVLTIYRALERVVSPDYSYDILLRALPYVVVVSIYIRISVVSAAVVLQRIGETDELSRLGLLEGVLYLLMTLYSSL